MVDQSEQHRKERAGWSRVFSELVSGRLAGLVRRLLHREVPQEGAGNKRRDHVMKPGGLPDRLGMLMPGMVL